MSSRRKLLYVLGAGALTAWLPAMAQQEKRPRRIGYLMGGTPENNAAYLGAFRDGMGALRWADKRDYVIEEMYGYGDAKVIPGLAAKLVASQPDILMTGADDSVALLAQRTMSIPIVFAIGQYPVVNGFAESLQRPGGNITGVTVFARAAKRLQLLKEAFPRVVHIGLPFEPDNIGSVAQAKDIEDTARQLKIRVTRIELRDALDIEPAIKRGVALGVNAYVPTTGALLRANSRALIENINRVRIPAMYPFLDFVDQGGLMSYAPSNVDNYRRVASHVDKIFKGAKPGELPIEQPTKFEMAVNLRTAREQGLAISQSVLLRADRVIK